MLKPIYKKRIFKSENIEVRIQTGEVILNNPIWFVNELKPYNGKKTIFCEDLFKVLDGEIIIKQGLLNDLITNRE